MITADHPNSPDYVGERYQINPEREYRQRRAPTIEEQALCEGDTRRLVDALFAANFGDL